MKVYSKKLAHKSIKRNKYSNLFSFLISKTSLFILILCIFVVGSIIKNNYSSKIVSNKNKNFSQDQSINTTTDESVKLRFEIYDYQVIEGDTLQGLADKFKISVDTIRWANSLKTESLIPGQMLRILPVTGVVHKVSPGDTVYSLAKRYNSEAEKIVNFPANDFADLDTFALNIGQILFIPDGVMPGTVALSKLSPTLNTNTGSKFIWPTQGKIIQYPNADHMAVDIANASSPPVAAADSGVVDYAGCLRYGYGCHMIISHADGFQTLYGHLSQYNVEAGNSVGRGQVIGRMGNTGASTETSLHFEIRKNGVLLNPLNFLK